MIIYKPFKILLSSILRGTRSAINFIAGSNVTLTVTDNPSTDQVDITITSTGGGTGLTHAETMSRISIGV